MMRVVGPSMTSVSALRHLVIGLRATHLRLFHSPAQMQKSENPREIPAAWLRRIMEDDTKPPKLYAWTPNHLSAESGAGFDPAEGAHGGSGTRGCDDDDRQRVHILGIGNIGILYAMCLSKIANDPPPITLVVHRKELLERWAAEPGLELTRHGQAHRNAGFDIEWWTDTAPGGDHTAEVAAGRTISNLIVATKASDALSQIDRVRRYLDSNSTVAFAQNGMCKLWPPVGDTYVRARFPDGTSPNWIACVTTHGVTSQGPFKSTHAAPANALVGPVMSSGVKGEEQTGYLMRQIASAPDLDAQVVTRKELWVAQLEKLVINAIINPLTAVLRCQNGEIFVARDDALPTVIDKLLSEASETLSALIRDPTSDGILIPDSLNQAATSNNPVTDSQGPSRSQLLERFSFPRLRSKVLDVGAKVSANTSSMHQDVRAGKPTEIDDFNGWLIDTAKLLDKGLQLPTNERLIALVKGQAVLNRSELCARLLAEDHC